MPFLPGNPCLSFAFFPTMVDNVQWCRWWMHLFRTTPRLVRPGQGTRDLRVLIGERRSSPILHALAWDRPSVGLHARPLESADTRQRGRAQVRSARRRQPLWAFGTAAPRCTARKAPSQAPRRCPAMQARRPKGRGYRPLDTHVWVELFYQSGSL